MDLRVVGLGQQQVRAIQGMRYLANCPGLEYLLCLRDDLRHVVIRLPEEHHILVRLNNRMQRKE